MLSKEPDSFNGNPAHRYSLCAKALYDARYKAKSYLNSPVPLVKSR